MRYFSYALAGLFFALASVTHAQDPVIQYTDSDKQMNGAIVEAQKTFPLFMAQYYRDANDTGAFLDNFSVKVAIPTSVGGWPEYIWVSPFIETETGFLGLLANEPVDLQGLSYGSEVVFTLDQIGDWSYMRNGRAFGNYTTRVMLPDLDIETAQQLRDYLSETPLPGDWAL